MISFLKRRFKSIIFILIVIALIIIGYQKRTQTILSKKQEKTTVKQGNLEETLTISGEVDAEEKVTLRFKTSGKLSWVGIKEGDRVKKYQTIATLDQKELKKTLEKELNDYLNERWDFDQTTKDDYRDKVVTDSIKRILDKAQFDLNNAILDVELQDLSVQYANLWTPIEGIVTRVDSPYAGVNITAAQAEFEIINPKTIYFSANADQTEVTQLSEKLPGELSLDSYPDELLTGIIKDISFTPKSGETGTVYDVKFVFDNINDNIKYRLGMTGDLNFVTKSKKNVLYLPIKYINEENNKKYVYIEEDGTRQKKYITTGIETDSNIEITRGLAKGNVIYR